ncbi:MAG: hypothetical protein ACPG5B_07440 [Chitinophagales bacterium]
MLCFTLFSCSYSGEYSEVKVNNAYKMSFPDFMEAADSKKQLSETASLQYLNYFRNIYTIVNEFDKIDSVSLSDFSVAQKSVLTKALQKPIVVSETELEINGLAAKQHRLTGVVGNEELNEKMYYCLTHIEGEKKRYEVVFWTWDKHRTKYSADIDKIVASFEEL